MDRVPPTLLDEAEASEFERDNYDRIPSTLLSETEESELECDNYDRIYGDTRYQEEQTVIPNQRQNHTIMCQYANEAEAPMPHLTHS